MCVSVLKMIILSNLRNTQAYRTPQIKQTWSNGHKTPIFDYLILWVPCVSCFERTT